MKITLINYKIFHKNTKLSIITSIVGGLAFAPFNQPIALFCYFYGLFATLYQEKKIGKFLQKAYVLNFCFFLTQFYWVAWSFKVKGVIELMPVGLFGLPGILAIYPTICLIPSFYRNYSAVQFGWLAGLGVFVSEILRSFLFTGFPWNLSGYVWDINLLQSTSIFGIFGLSFLTICGATVIFTKQKKLGVCIFSCLLALWFWGQKQLIKNPTEFTKTTIRLVQPSINQEEKWNPDFLRSNIERLEILTQVSREKIDITIWPEAAIILPLNEIEELQEYLKKCIPDGFLISGAIRTEKEKIFNSIYVIESGKKVEAIFDKFHLVPFGEYAPLRWLNPFPKLTEGTKDYSEGSGPKTVKIDAIKESLSPLICYEIIFSGMVTSKTERPDWILNITNDAWFGVSSEPFQHLKISQVRAIEEGLPVVRVANNGISAVIDSKGRIIDCLELNHVGYIDSFIPKKTKETIYKKILTFLWIKLFKKLQELL